MKIYKLEVNEIARPHYGGIGAYGSARTLKKEEFYLNMDMAKKRQDEIYSGISKLIEFIPSIEAIISEVEVIE